MAPTAEHKTVFAMGRLAALIRDHKKPSTGTLEDLLQTKIETALAGYAPLADWDLAWGPAVKTIPVDHYAVNTLVCFKNRVSGDYVVATAGTNTSSWFDWVFEDLLVMFQTDWIYGSPPAGAKISLGTSIGFGILRDLVPTASTTGLVRPGAGLPLTSYLDGEYAGLSAGEERKVWCTGHSLGGALSPTLAQYLYDTRPGWRPAPSGSKRLNLWVLATAGPSPGNSLFHDHADSTLADRIQHYVNPKDPVPRGWMQPDLEAVKSLYNGHMIPSLTVFLLVNLLKSASRNGDYKDLDTPIPDMTDRMNPHLIKWWRMPITNFWRQMDWQHMNMYVQDFDYTYPEPPMRPDHNPPVIDFLDLMTPALWRATVRAYLRGLPGAHRLVPAAYRVRLPADDDVLTLYYPPHPEHRRSVDAYTTRIAEIMRRRGPLPERSQ